MIRTDRRGAAVGILLGVLFIATWIATGLAQMPRWPDDGYSTNLRQRVTRVEAGGPAEAAGLQIGDRIMTVGGVPAIELPAPPRRAYPDIGESQTLEIEREGAALTIELTYAPHPRSYRLPRILGGVVALSFLGAATWVFLTVATPAGLLFSVYGLAQAFSLVEGPFVGPLEGLAGLTEVTAGVLSLILLLHLFLVFPTPKQILNWRHVRKIIYGPLLVFAVLGIVELILDPRFYGVFAAAALGWVLVYLVLILWAFGHGWVTARPGQRWGSGMGMILVGLGVAVAPQLLRLTASILAPDSALLGAEFYSLFGVAIPVSMAWAMRKHSRGLPEIEDLVTS